MPSANGIEQANGKIGSVRADQAEMQHRLRVHHMGSFTTGSWKKVI